MGTRTRELGPPRLRGDVCPAYTTAHGACYQGDCRDLLAALPPESVQLVFTSPPFPLRRQKAYGNVSADRYIDWLMPMAAQIRRVLRHDGSFVMELGGGWNEGRPTRSLMPYALVLELGSMFHLCQEFYWWNTRAIPSPAEWVCKHRMRVKAAATCFWWFGKAVHPFADTWAILKPYARTGRHFASGKHPSGHAINGATWQRDNGGAIPPNVFAFAGLDANDPHHRGCRAAGLTIHPARMPPELPEFFVRFLTRPGDVVCDPFGGSNTTGQVAEQLGRRWLSFEVREEYVTSSRLRFSGRCRI